MKKETKKVDAKKVDAKSGSTDKHPKINEVIFKDMSCDFAFKTTSTLSSNETIKWEDGKTYPLVKVEISSASHPFYTGKQRVMDTEGRIDRFKKKYGRK